MLLKGAVDALEREKWAITIERGDALCLCARREVVYLGMNCSRIHITAAQTRSDV